MIDMSRVAIRRYHPQDRGSVLDLGPRLAIGVAGWRDPARVLSAVRSWIETSLASAHDADHAVLVAVVDDRVGELVTAEHLEGRGVGRALLAAAEDWVRQRGRRCLTPETGARNSRALSFYRRSGYADEDVRLTKVLSPA